MKLAKAVTILLFFSSVSFGYETWVTSNTATADTTKSLCGSKKGRLRGLCVNDASAGSGTVSLFDSRGSATNPIAVVRSTAAAGNCMFYDYVVSSGVTYSNSATNNITILYSCH